MASPSAVTRSEPGFVDRSSNPSAAASADPSLASASTNAGAPPPERVQPKPSPTPSMEKTRTDRRAIGVDDLSPVSGGRSNALLRVLRGRRDSARALTQSGG